MMGVNVLAFLGICILVGYLLGVLIYAGRELTLRSFFEIILMAPLFMFALIPGFLYCIAQDKELTIKDKINLLAIIIKKLPAIIPYSSQDFVENIIKANKERSKKKSKEPFIDFFKDTIWTDYNKQIRTIKAEI